MRQWSLCRRLNPTTTDPASAIQTNAAPADGDESRAPLRSAHQIGEGIPVQGGKERVGGFAQHSFQPAGRREWTRARGRVETLHQRQRGFGSSYDLTDVHTVG